MNSHRFPVGLLAAALGMSSAAAFATGEAKPAEAAKPATQGELIAPLSPTAKSAEPAKNAPVPKPAPPPVQPPSEVKLRAVITKGLGFLGKEGETWIEDRKCNSCHHVPGLLWSHREAQRRGFPVDRAKFDEWLAWSSKEASKPNADEAAFLLLALPERPAPDLVNIVASKQGANGAWAPGGQFTGMQARGAPDATANSLHLFLLALATAPGAQAESGAALVKAAAALQKKDLPTSLESLAYGVLFADHFRQPQEASRLRTQIMKFQRGDGGWSSLLGTNQSDPLATGQALYALQPAMSDSKIADAIARAQNWLVELQHDDGSWPIDYTHISKVDRSASDKAKSRKDVTMIYTYWGTSWATLGLLQTVPISEPPAVTAK